MFQSRSRGLHDIRLSRSTEAIVSHHFDVMAKLHSRDGRKGTCVLESFAPNPIQEEKIMISYKHGTVFAVFFRCGLYIDNDIGMRQRDAGK